MPQQFNTIKCVVVGTPSAARIAFVESFGLQKPVPVAPHDSFSACELVDSFRVVIPVKQKNNSVMRPIVEVWDCISDSFEFYSTIRQKMYEEADAVVITFDMHNAKTLQLATQMWFAEVRMACLQRVPLFLVGLQTDNNILTTDEAEQAAEKMEVVHYTIVNSTTAQNVQLVFEQVAQHVCKIWQHQQGSNAPSKFSFGTFFKSVSQAESMQEYDAMVLPKDAGFKTYKEYALAMQEAKKIFKK